MSPRITALVKLLEGCPSGATRDALRLNKFTDAEISEACLAGFIRREVRHYANPRNFKVDWFYIKRGSK